MTERQILVTGGAGYIGSHVVKQLSEAGYEVIVYDNLSTGHREALLYNEKLIVGDVADRKKLEQVFSQHTFAAVLHFAAAIDAGESVSHPLKYYANNTENTIKLLQICTQKKIKHLIFSSTAAVYGIPENGIADETTPVNPINPYGASKLMSERIIRDTAHAHDLNYVILRYFNVAGADPAGRLGQRNQQTSHLIKSCCLTAQGLRKQVAIFGTDYPTPDGTCIRDYIHVEDIASAHLAALHYLLNKGASVTLNVGYGKGYSVREVIKKAQQISGKKFPVIEAARRAGDPVAVLAQADRIKKILNWVPHHQSLDKIIADAWRWEQACSHA